MTREQVIEWAKAANFVDQDDAELWADELTELCRLAREDMREECAKACEVTLTGGLAAYARAIRNLEV
jgi:L-lactate utilization protein LutB